MSARKIVSDLSKLKVLRDRLEPVKTLSISTEDGIIYIMSETEQDFSELANNILSKETMAKIPSIITTEEAMKEISRKIKELEVGSSTDAPFKIQRKEFKDPEDMDINNKVTAYMTFDALFNGIALTPVMDPRFSDTIGKKSISTYRSLFIKSLSTSSTPMSAAKLIVNITMSMKSRPRILSFFNSAEGLKFTQVDTDADFAYKYFKDYTQEFTSLMDDKMPTTKIPDSIPEIASLIFIQAHLSTVNSNSEIAESLVNQLWASSIYWSSEMQEINKSETKRQWNLWGLSSGRKLNRNKQVLEFQEDIYANSAADRVMLRLVSSTEFPHSGAGYTMEDLISYVAQVRTGSSNVRVITQFDSDRVALIES